MALKSKFYEIGSVSNGSDDTVTSLTVQGLNTDYAMFHIVFDGALHFGTAAAAASNNSWQYGPTVQMQGAWAGGPNASSAKYRNMMVQFLSPNGNYQMRLGNGRETYATTSYGSFPQWWYETNAYDFGERITMEGHVMLPGDNVTKIIAWTGGGPNPGSPSMSGNYGVARWLTYTKLDSQHSDSAVTSMGPMDSIRIGAGTDTSGNALSFKPFSRLTVYGMGWTDVFNT